MVAGRRWRRWEGWGREREAGVGVGWAGQGKRRGGDNEADMVVTRGRLCAWAGGSEDEAARLFGARRLTQAQAARASKQKERGWFKLGLGAGGMGGVGTLGDSGGDHTDNCARGSGRYRQLQAATKGGARGACRANWAAACVNSVPAAPPPPRTRTRWPQAALQCVAGSGMLGRPL